MILNSTSLQPSRAIVTITIGDAFWRMAEITHPFMKSYASKCKADFIVIDKPLIREKLGLATTYEKFQLYDILQYFDQIAFIDSDILIVPDSPCVFDLVPANRFAACSEAVYSQSERDKRVTQKMLGPVCWKNTYFNTGMMVFGKEYREIFNPEAPELLLWATGDFRKNHPNLLNDQPYLNHRLNKLGIDLLDLGYTFNHTRVIKNTKIRFRSHFIHYAGPSGFRYGTRLEQLRKDALVLNSPIRLWLSRRFLLYRWIADRLSFSFLEYLYRQRVPKALKWNS